MDTPYYLRQGLELEKPDSITDFSFNYDYSYMDANKSVNEKNLWENIVESADNGIDMVFNRASGVWESAKSSVTEVTDLGGNFLEKVIDKAKEYIFWIIGGLLVIIFVVGKSGIVGQAAGFMKP